MTWTQPVCEARWREMYGDREPTRLRIPEAEWDPCCYCRTPTNIYVRLDPTTVPFPMGG
jgi:hypothetical protein